MHEVSFYNFLCSHCWRCVLDAQLYHGYDKIPKRVMNNRNNHLNSIPWKFLAHQTL